ncbi:LapA family protein [Pleurocapsa sp. PCC 7319]|uniref:LapA family protein n=1 Tax=Pleurocapsa sp. PCC 7319 TaxID=118161 RepID=UPI00034544C6|nr:LapA family protein [Pleurocapsa sp. PCC 7319]
MKALAGLLNSLLLATWVIAIAIFSIQNIQDVSVKFLTLESITVPVGVLLAFCSGIGMILGWVIPLLFVSKRKSRRSY